MTYTNRGLMSVHEAALYGEGRRRLQLGIALLAGVLLVQAIGGLIAPAHARGASHPPVRIAAGAGSVSS